MRSWHGSVPPRAGNRVLIDARSDLYPRAYCFFELPLKALTGDSAVAVAYQHVQTIPPLLLTWRCSRGHGSRQMKALAKNPDDRSSAAAMKVDLCEQLTAPARECS